MNGNMVYSSIDIAASPEEVWSILTDTASYPEWNPFILELKGDLVLGGRIRVYLRLGPLLRLPFRPTITALRPNREIRWVARQPIPGLLDIERAFEFIGLEGGGTRFVQYEIGRGLIAPIAMPLMHGRVAAGYARLNAALRQRAEKSSVTTSSTAVPDQA